MRVLAVFTLVWAVCCASHCNYGEAGSRPQSLITCKSLTDAELGKNIKLNGKSGPFETIMDLELTNFTGKLDTNTLSMFPKLQRLVIQDSKFPKVNALPFEKCCSNLKVLSIRNNQDATIEAGAFKNLKTLEELNINNKLPKLTKDFFQGLDALKKLTLRKTKIAEIEENAFENLKAVESIELYDNTFSTIKPKTFNSLKNLKKLSILDNAALKVVPLDLFKEQKKLELLGLPSEVLSKVDLVAMKKQLPALKKLEFKVEDKKKYEEFLKKAQAQSISVNFIGIYF